MELAEPGWQEELKRLWPEKLASERQIFSHINPGHRIFIGTGCAEPQYLVSALVNYVRSYPTAFFDAEVIHVSTLGVAPYTDEKFRMNFRLDSFFIGESTRGAINSNRADYTPIFLSSLPDIFRKGMLTVDTALIQTSLPNRDGEMNLGISVDIIPAVLEQCKTVVVQANPEMPRVPGDTTIHVDDVEYIVPHEEPLLEYREEVFSDLAQAIGQHVAKIVEDGSTIQVGYGSIPNAVLTNLQNKKNLGVHTELLTDGIVNLMRQGVVDNSRKSLDRGTTVATFCMGSRVTYRYLDQNSDVQFRSIDYTNNPLNIARQKGMIAINSALEIDLTGQSTAESLGRSFYSGVGGQADFMRGAAIAPGGKSILALPSTANGREISRIVPFLKEGAGVTLTRGDVHYVVTEYGIAYLHGKNIRERAMALISIAHPSFRHWLMEEARAAGLIYPDQEIVEGEAGLYPEGLEIRRRTRSGLDILIRPAKITDESMLKDFFYALSDDSRYQRFISARREMPRQLLQQFSVMDFTRKMVLLALYPPTGQASEVLGVGQYELNQDLHTAEVALAVLDQYQNQGVGQELLSYLTQLAKRMGLLGFTAQVLTDNDRVFRLFERLGFEVQMSRDSGICDMKLTFR